MKKYIIINSVGIFILSALFHFGYQVLLNDITGVIFPINESIFEHQKMIITSVLIWNIIEYIIYKKNKINTKNKVFTAFLTSIINVIVFLIIYLPVYYIIGEKMIITLIIYFISIVITEMIATNIIKKQKKNNLNILGISLILITYIIITYLTYNPPKCDFFLDKEQNKYGYDILNEKTS